MSTLSDEIVGINEAAEILGINVSLVRLYLRQGRIRGAKLTARAWAIRRSDLEAFAAIPRHAGRNPPSIAAAIPPPR